MLKMIVSFLKHALSFVGQLVISLFSGYASKEKAPSGKGNTTLTICDNSDSNINGITVNSTNQGNKKVDISQNKDSTIQHIQT